MGELQVEVEAGEVGLDGPGWAASTGTSARYVDDGRLPGWLLVVARRGRVAHLGTLRAARPRTGRCPSSSTPCGGWRR